MLPPVEWLLAAAPDIHKDVLPQPLERLSRHAAALGSITLDGTVLCTQHGQGSAHGFFSIFYRLHCQSP